MRPAPCNGSLDTVPVPRFSKGQELKRSERGAGR